MAIKLLSHQLQLILFIFTFGLVANMLGLSSVWSGCLQSNSGRAVPFRFAVQKDISIRVLDSDTLITLSGEWVSEGFLYFLSKLHILPALVVRKGMFPEGGKHS